MQDNIRNGPTEAQEDEFALCVASLCSPYLGWWFPRSAGLFERYLTFRDVPDADLAQWKSAFVTLAQKLSLRYARPLVFKSPTHTCRIKLLLELFPDARFVHIHRDPYIVFQSMRRLFHTAIAASRLQVTNERDIDEQILRTGATMYERFFA